MPIRWRERGARSVAVTPPTNTLVWELDTDQDDTFAVHTGTQGLLVHNKKRCRPPGDKDTLGSNPAFRKDLSSREVAALERFLSLRLTMVNRWYSFDFDSMFPGNQFANLRSRLRRSRSAVENDFDASDFAGRTKEARGVETPGNHLDSTERGIASTENAVRAIDDALSSGGIASEAAAELERMRQDLVDIKVEMTPIETEQAFEDADTDLFWRMLLVIGNEDAPLTQYEPKIRSLLNHESPAIVAEAIEMLAVRWKQQSFLEECKAFAASENEEISERALDGLSVLGIGSGDFELASFFFDVLKDESRSSYARGLAIRAIPRVLEGTMRQELSQAASAVKFSEVDGAELTSAIPWDDLNEIMDRHRPR